MDKRISSFSCNVNSPHDLAAIFIASVAFLVKIISLDELAFKYLLIKILEFSNSSVAFALNWWAPL